MSRVSSRPSVHWFGWCNSGPPKWKRAREVKVLFSWSVLGHLEKFTRWLGLQRFLLRLVVMHCHISQGTVEKLTSPSVNATQEIASAFEYIGNPWPRRLHWGATIPPTC